jgi:peptidoglycan-associated lipoprotein
MNSGQSGMIEASTDAYNPNDTTTSGYDPAAPYDPLAEGFNDGLTNSEPLNSGTEYNSFPAEANNVFATPSSKDTIYFKYDSSEVENQFIPIINQYSEYLRTNSDQVMILEGHADERGTREYNIALGEERAKSVARMMEAKGVFKGQLEIISYGEEKPASSGHNEAAWHLNRRVNLIYQRTNK